MVIRIYTGLSDPYVVAKLNGTQFHKTKVQKKTVDPTFNETVQTAVATRRASVIVFELFDHNSLQKDVSLGSVSMQLRTLVPGEVKKFTFDLQQNGKPGVGKLSVRLYFDPGEVEGQQGIDMQALLQERTKSSINKFTRSLTNKVNFHKRDRASNKSAVPSVPKIIDEEPTLKDRFGRSMESIAGSHASMARSLGRSREDMTGSHASMARSSNPDL
jgi:C2 domain